MNSYLLADKVLQFFLNSLTSFLFFSLIAEGLLRLFRISNPRLRATLRLAPMGRLAFEPVFLILPHLSLGVNLNIFSCSHPIQIYLFGFLSEGVKEQLGMYGLKTVAASFLVKFPSIFIDTALLVLFSTTFYQLFWRITRNRNSILMLRSIAGRGVLNHRPIFSNKLRAQILQNRIQIVISNEVQVPLAGWGSLIIIPDSLAKKLSQGEFEAVIAHELEHELFRDTFVRGVYQLVSSVYWWVPMQGWFQKIEFEQELASDHSIYKYGLEGMALASALQKAVKMRNVQNCQLAALTSGQMLICRIKAALQPSVEVKDDGLFQTACVGSFVTAFFAFGFCIC